MSLTPFGRPADMEGRTPLRIGRRYFIGALGAGFVGLHQSAFAQGPAVRAYHDASSATHQQQFDSPDGPLKKGFRIQSLSVYRNASATLYAAVWTNAKGPEWRAFHGLSAGEYQSYYNDATSKGFRPTIITATGGGTVGGNQTNASTFAGVFEKDSIPCMAKHGIDLQTFKETCAWAKGHDHVLQSATIYGGINRLHAGLWERAPGVAWDYKIMTAIDGPGMSIPLTMPGNDALRLAYVTRSPFGEYLTVYRSDVGAGQAVAKGGMTSAQYQAQFDALTAQGLTPICVQAGGDPRVDSPPVFVALFRKRTLAITVQPDRMKIAPKIQR